MNINELISIVKIKITKNILIEHISIEDKTFLHEHHKSHENGLFHLKLTIKSKELNNISKIESTKKIYNILDDELKQYIHSIQILIN
jgi:BolA protein|tara:strand:- start:23 stop:283 length:261 start_codon:yes stop_codon:yes gene_type:complete